MLLIVVFNTLVISIIIFIIIISNELLICLSFQLIKRQSGITSRVTGATVGAPVQAAAIVSLNLARHIRNKLPALNREDFSRT
jgi:hypothetical protein